MNRYLPFDFVKLLGYHQAEGGKPVLRKRRGREFNFTNKRMDLIKDFMKKSEHLIDKRLWNVTIRHNINIKKEMLDKVKKELLKEKVNKIDIKPATRIKHIVIKIWISNSILAETIENLNDKIKNLFLENKTKIQNDLYGLYFRGYLAGDGNFYSYRDKYGSLHSRLYLYEEKERYIKNQKSKKCLLKNPPLTKQMVL